jgi:cytoskeletal protein CcmA (bactofilin family)
MYQETLRAFEAAVTAAGFDISATSVLQESVDAPGGGLTGQFVIALVTNKDLWIALGSVLVGWLTARNGRKLKVKVDGIEVEGQTAEDVRELLKSAQEIQDRNRPKVIREP